ncbi:MAG TPA: hypothetical protein PKK15_07320 [Kouleothrix sp.]|uniref:hypothetical protein n=1 Tax=Kouleothrix sp. TaxID=2779161 RepID=UPI002C59D22C|nr:hypothetical protein [Kouleothrix sp.]
MNTNPNETTRLDDRAERRSQRQARRAARYGVGGGSIAGGVFLVGLGMLALTGWWWPGIMLVIGAASAAELARRGQVAAAAATFVGFAAIPVGIALFAAINVPWLPVGAFVLIALGLISLARTVAPAGEPQE